MHDNFWKKCFSVFVALLMIFSNAQNFVYAEGDGSSNSTTGDYNVEIQKAQYWNGNDWVDLTNGTTISNGTRVKIQGSYSVSNLIDKSEDKDIQIPLNTENLNVDNYPAANIVGGLGSYYEIKNNTIYLHLTSQYLQANSNIEGTLNIEGQVSIDDSKTDDNKEVSIKLGDKGYTVIYDKYPNESSLSVSKFSNNNVVLENGKFYQSYTVTLDARNGDVSIESLNDIYTNSVQEISGGFDVTYNYNNTVHVNSLDEIASSSNPYVLKNGQNLKITYRTQVLKDVGDMMLDSFESDSKNGFTAQYKTNKDTDHTTPEVNAHVNVTKPSVTKNGVYSDGKITWTVTINVGSYKDLTNKKLSDLINGAITDVTSANIQLSEQLTVSDFADNGNGVYTATYTTDIVNKDSMKPETATNTVDFKIGGKDYSATGTVTIPTQKQLINKSFNSVDLDAKALNWIVDVSFIENMSSVKLSDQGDHQQLDNSVNYIKLDDKVLLENGELTADGHEVFQSVNKKWHGAELLFNDQYVKDHAGKTKSFLIKTYVDSFEETTYENTATLDYSYDNQNYSQTSTATFKNVNLLRKDGVVNQQTDQIDYTLTSYLTDISGLKAGDTVSIIDNLDKKFIIKNNEGSISAEYVSIQSQWNSPAINTIHPVVTYDSNSHTFNYVVTQEFLDYAASKPDPENTDNRFGLRIKYSAVPENLSDFYKDNSNGVEVTNTAEIKVNGNGLYSTSTKTNIKPKEILKKEGTNKNGNTKLNYAIYTVTVNPNGIKLNNGSPLTGVDSLNKNFSYILDSIRVVNANNGQSISEDKFSYNYTHENNTLTFTLPDETPIKISYEASINLPKDTELDNNNSGNTFTLYGSSIKSDNTKTYSFSGKYEPTMTIDGETANLSVHKYDFDNNKVNLDGAKFSIYECTYDSATDEMTVSETPFAYAGKTVFETKNGNTLVQGLHLDLIYKLVEVEAPRGYEKDSSGLYFYFKGNSYDVSRLPNDSSKFKLNYFLNTQGSIEVSNKKQEENKGNLILTKHFGGLDVNSEIFDSLKDLISFTVNNSSGFNRTISLKDAGWNVSGSTYSYELKDLPIGTYTVSENGQTVVGYKVNTEYEVGSSKTNHISVQSTTTSSMSITNTYEKQTTSYSVEKKWSDSKNQLQVRPDSVKVQLYADNSPVDGQTVELSNDNNWKYEWTGLDKFNADGSVIKYSAQEVDVNPNYSVSYDGNIIKNTLKTTSYQVVKKWDDENNAAKKRPSEITVQLQRKAEDSDAIEFVDSEVLNEANGWEHTFKDLLIANKDGKTYTYSVVESNVDSYVSDVALQDSAFEITNTYQEQGREITISKTDGNNVEITGASLKLSRINGDSKEEIASWISGQDGKNSDDTIKSHVVKINPGTYYLEETSAPEHFKITEPITFEVAVDGTVSIITKNDQNEYFKTPCVNNVVQMVDQNIQQTSYSVEKVWNDNNNAANKRPSEITVKLQRKLSTEETFSNVVDVVTLNDENEWNYTWNALDATDQSGNSYVYQAVEAGSVNGYISSSSNENNKTTITNTITSVKVSKVDITSSQELEGAHIQILDGNKVVEEWDSTSETHVVYGLETNKLYTLHETVAPDGYTLASDIPFQLNEDGNVVVTDLNKDSISNDGSILLKDALTSIRILKVDAVTNNPLAGAHIQIKDGENIVQEFDSTEDNAGIQINGLKTGVVYTLHESSAPANYTLATDTQFSLNADGSINLDKTNTDFDINNDPIVLSVKDVQIPKTSYSVQKEWDDNNNAFNNRPSTIQVQLQSKLGNGEFTNYGDAVVLSQDTNWAYTWNDLPSSDAEGTKYTYQAVEVEKSENYLDPTYRYDASTKTQIITNKSYPVVEISKTNVLGDEIQGAVLTLVDTNGNEVARWISGSETNADGTIKTHYVQIAPGTYTLHEEATPDNNYVLAQDITFTVNENGIVIVNEEVVDHVTMIDQYNTHPINVSKVDIGGNEIAGASMKITDTPTGSGSEITPIEWVSGSDGVNEDGTLKNHIVDLQPGNYTLEETAVPDGNVYVKAANINFTVNVDGSVKVADNEAGDTVTMIDYYSDHGIVISKQDVNGAAVKGALLKLFDKENNEIASWETDGFTDHQVEVQPGTYTLHEEATPDNNYVLAQDITFTVDEEGKVLINGEECDKVVMVDTFAPHDVVISKTDLNGKELKGAKLEVTGIEEGGTEIEKISWVSDGNTKNISVKPGTYTLHEKATPDNNYVLAQDITFKVDSEGKVTVDGKPVERVTMVDDYSDHSVEICKTDVGGKELAGAQLAVVDANGIMIDSWTSSTKTHKVTVKPGTYTLHEDLSPVGYKVAKDITFDVDIEGKVTVNGKKVDQVVMVDEDQTYDIAISKQDITNNKELPGAKLSLKDTKTNKVVETWTSAS